MKTAPALAGALAVVLAGCTSWSKPGASEQEFYQAKGQCQAQAASTYPVVMTTAGGYQAPPQTNCTSRQTVYGTVQTNCTTTPGATMPGYQSDQNAIARAFAFNDCMRGLGWTTN